jgi:hypothetical protein
MPPTNDKERAAARIPDRRCYQRQSIRRDYRFFFAVFFFAVFFAAFFAGAAIVSLHVRRHPFAGGSNIARSSRDAIVQR